MKTLFYRFMALFVAMTMIVGCEKDPLMPNDEVQPQTLTVAALSNPETKVAFTPNEGDALGFKLNWVVGDRLYASSEDGDDCMCVFEIKAASDIAADGSATFTSMNEFYTLFLDYDKKYLFHYNLKTNIHSYNDAMAASAYFLDNMYDEAISKEYLMSAVLYSKEATTIDKPITLSHLFSYVELTVDVAEADRPNSIVRFKYTDSATNAEYIHKYELYNWEEAKDGSYTFNFPIYPATLAAAKPVTVELSVDSGNTYTTYLTKAVDGAFESGKHYRIKKEAVAPPALADFPTNSGPVVATKLVSGLGATTIKMTEIPTSGVTITESTDLSDMVFFIGYNKRTMGSTNVYTTFEDVTWSTSEPIISRVKYLKLTTNENGAFTLSLLRTLPTTPKTITITAKAPNEKIKSFDVILKGSATVTPDVATTSVELDRDLFVANLDAAMTLSATVLPADATNKKLNWKSSDTSIATVDANGKVTTKACGTATITATTQEGGKTATCTVMVGGGRVEPMYKVGDYFPNEYEPIGVVFMINNASSIDGYGSRGKIVALDEFRACFSTADDRTIVTNGQFGYDNTRSIYTNDSDFSDYPALQWIAEKNAVGCNFPSGTTSVWYLPSDEELRHLISGMCGYMMGGVSGIHDWGRFKDMNINEKGYTPDATEFNKKITDKGGKAISSYVVSSTIDNNMVYSLSVGTGRTGTTAKAFVCNVRAIMEFDVSAEQY